MLMSAKQPLVALEEPAAFVPRHIGVAPDDERKMLSAIGVPSRSALIDAVVPRVDRPRDADGAAARRSARSRRSPNCRASPTRTRC